MTANDIIEVFDEFIADWKRWRYESGLDGYSNDRTLDAFEDLQRRLHGKLDSERMDE